MDFDPKELFGEMSEEAWAIWTHSPVTSAFLRFLDDQIAQWRESAADLVELGHFKANADHEDQNIDVVRGKISTLRELRGISLSDIQRFYGVHSEEAGEQETGTQ